MLSYLLWFKLFNSILLEVENRKDFDEEKI